MKYLIHLFILCLVQSAFSQDAFIKGELKDPDSAPVIYANVVLYDQMDSSLVKVETSDEEGKFEFNKIDEGEYYLIASYVGYAELQVEDIVINGNTDKDLGVLSFQNSAVELATAVVTANRAMVEVKPDRTVFNVEGTINSTGDNGLGLLRKAPGVLIDNNRDISVLGRNGVLVYLDGKRLPLSGEELANYLENIPAEQIDRIDIITNPGAKYEAEGNAGIIDIRLKKDKSLGFNGGLNSTISQGRRTQGNASASGNYRNQKLNSFGVLGYNYRDFWNQIKFLNYQNGFVLDEFTEFKDDRRSYNYRWGTDFFVGEKHIIGFLISGRKQTGESNVSSEAEISSSGSEGIDSILIAGNTSETERNDATYNLNYRFSNGDATLNVDADYGRYRNDASSLQPNDYFSPDGMTRLSGSINTTETPVEIDIYTFKIDYEKPLLGGRLGAGTKISKVRTDNTFLFFDIINGNPVRNDQKSNIFEYDEMVYAGYLSFNRELSEKWNLSTGLRLEHTQTKGILEAFDPSLNEPPVESDYLSAFPNVGLSYQLTPEHVFNLNYGRRINRPDYNVLNPFKFQISELSFSKGNPFLKPEIVNNVELGYTLKHRYNFKLSYSKTYDQITRLIGPDESDPRAGFLNWDNLAEQTVISFNISAPVQVNKVWNAYFNAGVHFKDNQADYGDNVIVDLQAWSYNLYQQHTFSLPNKWKAELSGYYSGPGIWGGVFEYESNWALNAGIQRKFMDDKMNIKLSAEDIFFQSGWSGTSEFNGLRGVGMGNWDSQRVALSISYNFGNEQVKKARSRNTGLEEESSRVN